MTVQYKTLSVRTNSAAGAQLVFTECCAGLREAVCDVHKYGGSCEPGFSMHTTRFWQEQVVNLFWLFREYSWNNLYVFRYSS